jgi:S1-C subfamily serine protease
VYEEGRLSAVRLLLVEQMKGGEAVEEALGAGVIWDQRGHVVVNYHAVARALGLDAAIAAPAAAAGSPAASAAASVATAAPAATSAASGVRSLRCVVLDPSDGSAKDCAAQLVGASRLHDLAVLLLPDAAQELLTPVPLGSLATLRVGQSAFAVALNSLSYGIVSGLRRPLPSPAGGFVPGGAVQTDATIDAANSGGALLDSSGRLMGLCTAATGLPAATTRAGMARASSLGFAIPVDTVRAVVPQLIAYGRVVDAV